MRQLIVLVGLPGSGKSILAQGKTGWVVVSRDLIRREVFASSYPASYEVAVDRIFSTMIVEAVETAAETVCIDDINLMARDRKTYVELARLTDREPVAIVLPNDDRDVLYGRAEHALQMLRASSPRINVPHFPRERFDAMSRCYEAVHPEEGFSRILIHEELPDLPESIAPDHAPQRGRKKSGDRQHPIPLFTS